MIRFIRFRFFPKRIQPSSFTSMKLVEGKDCENLCNLWIAKSRIAIRVTNYRTDPNTSTATSATGISPYTSILLITLLSLLPKPTVLQPVTTAVAITSKGLYNKP